MGALNATPKSEVNEGNEGNETVSAGELFLYDEQFGYAAFEAGGRLEGSKALVCIGGLTDGLLSLRYLPFLATAVKRCGWRTFQPVLQSSYRGWGFGSLQDDAAGLDRLLSFLSAKRGISEVVLLGSSTGCQDAVHFLKVGTRRDLIRGIVLQAPVSDREALMVEERSEEELASLKYFKELASQMMLGMVQSFFVQSRLSAHILYPISNVCIIHSPFLVMIHRYS